MFYTSTTNAQSNIKIDVLPAGIFASCLPADTCNDITFTSAGASSAPCSSSSPSSSERKSKKNSSADIIPFKAFRVDHILYNPPATIVFWEDGTKTVVKCAAGEPFSEYNGFAAALLKKAYGSNSHVKKIISRKKVIQKKKGEK